MKLTINNKIGLIMLIMTLLIVAAGFSGLYGVKTLSKALDFTINKAWVTADGTMESLNSLQQEYLATLEILSGTMTLDDGRKKIQRISKEGVLIIKAQSFRTLELNKEDALERLKELIQEAVKPRKARRPTKPTRSSQRKRVDKKTKKGKTKALRGKVQV